MPKTRSQIPFKLISEFGVALDDSNNAKLLQAYCRNPNEMLVPNVNY
jgi:hypothetical protein